MEPEVSSDSKNIKLEKLPGYDRKLDKAAAKEGALRMMRNVITLSGKRFPMTVLVKSRGAIV